MDKIAKHSVCLVSDDPAPAGSGWDGPNIGATLPNNKNATHSIGLSPFFIAYAGIAYPLVDTAAHYDRSIISRGQNIYTWTSNPYVLGTFNYQTIHPSRSIPGYNRGYSLRCLVSTNNRIINKEAILVSDDEYNGSTDANKGMTLPEGIDAIYNAGLSPFFYMRNGRGSNTTGQEYATMWRGLNGSLWSSAANSDTFIHFLLIGRLSVSPSYDYNRSIAQSLRCLVSTNNG